MKNVILIFVIPCVIFSEALVRSKDGTCYGIQCPPGTKKCATKIINPEGSLKLTAYMQCKDIQGTVLECEAKYIEGSAVIDFIHKNGYASGACKSYKREKIVDSGTISTNSSISSTGTRSSCSSSSISNSSSNSSSSSSSSSSNSTSCSSTSSSSSSGAGK